MPFALIARYHVSPGNADLVEQTLRRMSERVKADEPNCLVYNANIDTENDHLFCLYEVYSDEAAVGAHRETPHFKELIEGIIVPVLDKRERELYRQVVA